MGKFRLFWALAAVAALAIAVVLLRARGASEPSPSEPSSFETSSSRHGAREATPVAGDGSALDPLAPARKRENALEVRVTMARQPSPGADVRVYLNLDPTRHPDSWRALPPRRTDSNGQARFDSSPGLALVVARGANHAIARRVVEIPSGGGALAIVLELERSERFEVRVVDDATSTVIPAATVTLTPRLGVFGPGRELSVPAEEQVESTSSSDGIASFEGLAAGSWRVLASAGAYAPSTLNHAKVPSREPVTLRLRGAAFLTGFIRRADGSPASDAEVWASGTAPGEPGRTGAEGGFSLEVAAGVYRLYARAQEETAALDRDVVAISGQTLSGLDLTLSAPARLTAEVVAKSSGGAITTCNAIVTQGPLRIEASCDGRGHFSVDALASGTADLTVSAPGFTRESIENVVLRSGAPFPLRIELGSTTRIRGRVLRPDGKPVQGAFVRAGGFYGPGRGLAPAQTNAEGRFELEHVTPGEVLLRAWEEPGVVGVEKNMLVRVGEVADVELTLEALGGLSGRVTRADGQPLDPDTDVLVLRTTRPYRTRGRGARVNADGTYRVELPAGEWKAHAARPGSASWNFAHDAQPVNITSGETTTLDLVVERERFGCTGRVVEPGGAPAAGAMVFVVGTPTMSTGTDEQGVFDVALHREEEWSTSEVFARKEGRFGQVKTAGGRCDDLVVQLKTGARVTGRVRDGSGAGVIGNFSIEVMIEGDQHTWFRKLGPYRFSGGEFELNDVPATRVELLVRTTDGRRGLTRVDLSASPSGEVEVVVEPGAKITGRVLAAKTRQPPHAATIHMGDGPDSVAVPIGADGSFELTELPPGKVSLAIYSQGFQHLRREVVAAAGRTEDLGDLLLEEAGIEPGSIGAYPSAPSRESKLVHINSVDRNGPAALAGVRENDQVLAIDGKPPESLIDAAKRLHGAPGSNVTLRLKRQDKTFEVVVTRAR